MGALGTSEPSNQPRLVAAGQVDHRGTGRYAGCRVGCENGNLSRPASFKLILELLAGAGRLGCGMRHHDYVGSFPPGKPDKAQQGKPGGSTYKEEESWRWSWFSLH